MLVIGSGNVVHNLGGVSRAMPDAGFDWAQRFDEQAKELMLTDPTDVGRLDGHRDFDLAVPTPDHFLPLLYVAGIAGSDEHAGGRAGRRLHLRLAVDDRLHRRHGRTGVVGIGDGGRPAGGPAARRSEHLAPPGRVGTVRHVACALRDGTPSLETNPQIRTGEDQRPSGQ